MKKTVYILLLLISASLLCIAASPRMHRDWMAVAASRSTAAGGDVVTDYWLKYSFEDALSGTAVDSSANGFDGTVVGCIATNGVKGYGYWFSGGASSNQIRMPVIGVSGGVARTVCMWVKQITAPGVCIYYSGSLVDGAPVGNRFAIIPQATLKNYVATYGNDGATVSACYTTNQWQHFAVTFDGSTYLDDTSCHIYVNGVLYPATGYGVNQTLISEDANYLLGTYKGTVNVNNLLGSMDEVRTYKRGLTSNEVWTIYNYEAP